MTWLGTGIRAYRTLRGLRACQESRASDAGRPSTGRLASRSSRATREVFATSRYPIWEPAVITRTDDAGVPRFTGKLLHGTPTPQRPRFSRSANSVGWLKYRIYCGSTDTAAQAPSDRCGCVPIPRSHGLAVLATARCSGSRTGSCVGGWSVRWPGRPRPRRACPSTPRYGPGPGQGHLEASGSPR